MSREPAVSRTNESGKDTLARSAHVATKGADSPPPLPAPIPDLGVSNLFEGGGALPSGTP